MYAGIGCINGFFFWILTARQIRMDFDRRRVCVYYCRTYYKAVQLGVRE